MSNSNYKGSAQAPSNIALSKYWGKYDDQLTLPLNDSISMTLDEIWTQTTVEFSSKYQQDSVLIGSIDSPPQAVSGSKLSRVTAHLDRFRQEFGCDLMAKVVSVNNFPMGVGIASSASAFSALTAAIIEALGIKLSLKQQSIWTRMAGSGSATRSVYGGFVQWKASKKSDQSFAVQLHSSDHWDLADLIVVFSTKEKKHSSLAGHKAAQKSPFLKTRLQEVKKTNQQLVEALKEKDFVKLGEALERENYIFHATAMTSQPPILYWQAPTVEALHRVRELREEGLMVYATLDAGPNVHLICQQKDLPALKREVQTWSVAQQVYSCSVGEGVKVINKHLF